MRKFTRNVRSTKNFTIVKPFDFMAHTATKILEVANRIYFENGRYRRGISFLFRSVFVYKREMRHLFKFAENKISRSDLFRACDFFDYIPRRSLFAKSTSWERLDAICRHVSFLEEKLGPQKLLDVERGIPIELFSSDFDDSRKWSLHLSGPCKEGLCKIELSLGSEQAAYAGIWFDGVPAAEKENAPAALWIGSLRERRGNRGNALACEFAKIASPQKILFYAACTLAKKLGCETVMAVSNAGTLKTRVKTDLDAIWEAAGGKPADDPRFYQISADSRNGVPEKLAAEIDASFSRATGWLF